MRRSQDLNLGLSGSLICALTTALRILGLREPEGLQVTELVREAALCLGAWQPNMLPVPFHGGER